VRESESERARGGRCGSTAGLCYFYRSREGVERPAWEGAALVMADHDGNHGGGGFQRKERRREWGVKAGLITSIEGGGRSGGVKATGCYSRRDSRKVEG
jgi:hypothetical protein